MGRGFEVVSVYKNKGIQLPVRKTSNAAGYDVEAAEDIIIPAYKPGIKPTLIPTGIKAYFPHDEYYNFMSINNMITYIVSDVKRYIKHSLFVLSLLNDFNSKSKDTKSFSINFSYTHITILK